MGYRVEVDNNNFSFDYSKSNEMVNTIKNNVKNKVIPNDYLNIEKIMSSYSIEEILKEFEFDVRVSSESNATISFFGEKFIGFEDRLFETIAPFANDGYIQCDNEYGECIRYIFKDGICTTKEGMLVWD